MSEPTAEVLALAQTLSPGLFPVQDNERVGRRRDREVAYRLAERVLDSDWLRAHDATITKQTLLDKIAEGAAQYDSIAPEDRPLLRPCTDPPIHPYRPVWSQQ